MRKSLSSRALKVTVPVGDVPIFAGDDCDGEAVPEKDYTMVINFLRSGHPAVQITRIVAEPSEIKAELIYGLRFRSLAKESFHVGLVKQRRDWNSYTVCCLFTITRTTKS